MRSDSDLSTFAYGFRPWTGAKAIADGPDILRYLRDAAGELGPPASIGLVPGLGFRQPVRAACQRTAGSGLPGDG